MADAATKAPMRQFTGRGIDYAKEMGRIDRRLAKYRAQNESTMFQFHDEEARKAQFASNGNTGEKRKNRHDEDDQDDDDEGGRGKRHTSYENRKFTPLWKRDDVSLAELENLVLRANQIATTTGNEEKDYLWAEEKTPEENEQLRAQFVLGIVGLMGKHDDKQNIDMDCKWRDWTAGNGTVLTCRSDSENHEQDEFPRSPERADRGGLANVQWTRRPGRS